MSETGYTMEEMIPIVAELAERYSGYESTSVTYEKANQLMEAVIYCIQEYEASRRNGVCTVEPSMKATLSENGNIRNILSVKNIPAKEAYELGYQLVGEKVRRMKEMYHALLPHFCSYGNTVLKETVRAIPEFLRWYDIRFEPQNTLLMLDYPLLVDWRPYTGIDAVYEYVKCICIEQKFLRIFPETYVTDVLRAFSEEYEEMFENLCGIVLADAVGHFLLKKPFNCTCATEEDRGRVQAILGMYSEQEAKRTVQELTKHFLDEVCHDNGDIWRYIEKECDNIVVRIRHSSVQN